MSKIFSNPNKREMWNKYVGFLDLSLSDYMKIQKSLMMEQINLWKRTKIGMKLLDATSIDSIEDFRSNMRITDYSDYQEFLLDKDESDLAKKPVYWIQTTWEGGLKPIKLAPYTREMLDTFRDNVISCMILSSSKRKYDYSLKNDDRILYGLAPLPYMTGLLPEMMKEASDIKFLPDVEDAINMSFKERNKAGFKMALKEGVEAFFGLGSVAYAISKMAFESNDSSSLKDKISHLKELNSSMKIRVINASIKNKVTKKDLKPCDLFHLKSFMVAGTDNKYYKDELEDLWGVRPLELFAGTEPSLIGTETWQRDGMYFFPNTAFYEFIPLNESIKNHLDKKSPLHPILMDEVKPGELYELAISVFKGGAFMRYRVGDIYRCKGIGNKSEGTKIPRFEYVDRVPWIIDVAGFSRFSEGEIRKVIEKSNLSITSFYATKGISKKNKPYLKLYVETDSNLSELEIKEELSKVFYEYDDDFKGLEKILGKNPLKVYKLSIGTISDYQKNEKGFMIVNSFIDPFSKNYGM